MRLLAAALSALAAGLVASAQQDGGSRAGRGSDDAADGGTRKQRASKTRTPPKVSKPIILGDPPGTLSNWTAAQKEPQHDAGTKVTTTVQELQKEIADLRARTTFLEKQVAVSQEQTQVLQQMSQQLQDLRAQMATAEDRRSQAEQQGQAQKQQYEQAVAQLVTVQNVLASGNSDVLDALGDAEGALPPQARRDLGSVRYAIQNHDLSAARAYLQSAIADAQSGR